MQRSCCRSDSRQSNRFHHSRRCYLPCRSRRAAGRSPRKAMTELTHRAHEDLFDLSGFHPTYTEDPWPLPFRNRFAPTGRTPPDLKERMSLRQAKSRVVNSGWSVRAIDVISGTPVRVRRGLYLVVNHRTHWRCCPHWTGQQRMSPALCASQYAERSRLPVTGFGGSKRSFLRVQPPDDRFEQLRRQIDWELTEGEIQPRRPGQHAVRRSQHQSHVTLRDHQAERQRAFVADPAKNTRGDAKQREKDREGKHRQFDHPHGIGQQVAKPASPYRSDKDEQDQDIKPVDRACVPLDGGCADSPADRGRNKQRSREDGDQL